MVYVVATRGKLLKGTSREQAFLQKRPVAIKHFCERDQSRSQITTSNYKLDNPDIKLREELTTCEKEKCELLESREKNLLKITSQEAKIKSYEAQIERLEKDRKDKEDHQRKEYEREDKRLNEVKEKMTSLNYEKLFENWIFS